MDGELIITIKQWNLMCLRKSKGLAWLQPRIALQFTLFINSNFTIMEIKDFVVCCLGFGLSDETFEDYCGAFDVDFDEDDVYDAIRICSGDYSNVANELYYRLFEKIISQYKDEPSLDRNLWGTDCNGLCSALYYDGVRIDCPEDVEEIIEANSKG